MTPTKQYGGPLPKTSTSPGKSAKHLYPSENITFSSVILRALDARPANEDRIRGMA